MMESNQASTEDCNTIPKLLKAYVEAVPDRELFVFYNDQKRDSLTNKQIWTLSGKMAALIRGQGFQRHDVIANTLPNSPERVITDLGIMLAGCISMNGQLLFADGKNFFENAATSKCRGVVVCPEDWFPVWRVIGPYVEGHTSGLFAPMSCPDRAPDLKMALLVPSKISSSVTLAQAIQDTPDQPFYELGNPEDIFVVFATSGSTGYSKLVPMDHAGATSILPVNKWPGTASDIIARLKKDDRQIEFSNRPLGWLGGYPFTPYLLNQPRLLLDYFAPQSQNKRTSKDFWNAICREKCRTAVLFPTEACDIVEELASKGEMPNAKLDIVRTSGQPMRRRQVSDALKLSKAVQVLYVSTETARISVDMIRDANEYTDFYVGKVRPDLQLRIVDENGSNCKAGTEGCILVKGPSIFRGYFNKLEDPDPKTLKAFTSDGWFNTGDTGYLNEDGSLFVFGRGSDAISHGSFILQPAWLEAKISEHPDVIETAVLPVSHQTLFQAICACVKVRETSVLTEEELKQYTQSLFMTAGETTPVPEFFKIFKASDFPLTATGKCNRMLLRNMVEEEFGWKSRQSMENEQ